MVNDHHIQSTIRTLILGNRSKDFISNLVNSCALVETGLLLTAQFDSAGAGNTRCRKWYRVAICSVIFGTLSTAFLRLQLKREREREREEEKSDFRSVSVTAGMQGSYGFGPGSDQVGPSFMHLVSFRWNGGLKNASGYKKFGEHT